MEPAAVTPQLPLHVQGEGRTLGGDTAGTGFKGPVLDPRSDLHTPSKTPEQQPFV